MILYNPLYGLMWVKRCHLHHPPVITNFIGGINHSQMIKWVVYDTVLPTLVDYHR